MEPDVISFNMCLTACQGRWPESLELLQQMAAEQLEADCVTASVAIGACKKA